MSGYVTLAVHMRAVACQRLKCKQTEQLGEKMLTEQVYLTSLFTAYCEYSEYRIGYTGNKVLLSGECVRVHY